MANKRKNKRDNPRVIRVRNLIIGASVLVVAGVVAWGTLYSSGVTIGKFVEGEHYEVIENPPKSRPGAPITVTEFFSYGCIHCKNFDPLIEDWHKSLADDARFVRAPVSFSPEWGILAQTYLALEALDALGPNHERLFHAIHDSRRSFASADAIGDFVHGKGVSKDEFMRTYRSPKVRERLNQIAALQRKVGVTSVPSLVVADKYVINMDVGRKVSLDVASDLIALERSSAKAPPDQTP